MLIKIKNLIALLLIIVLTVSSNFNAMAMGLSMSEKTNFEFISTDDIRNVEYTYQQNGKKFKVIEHSNESLTVVPKHIHLNIAEN